MKKVIGFILLCMAIGMAIVLFLRSHLLSICIIIFFLVLGYNLFNCE